MPSVGQGANINFTPGVGVSGKQWFCDTIRIYETPIPRDAQFYKTFSVYYVGGVGFWVLNGDARRPPNDDDWHPLQFAFPNTDYAAYLTNAGQSQALHMQPQDGRWAHMLLPTTNHTHNPAPTAEWGGLIGELPILLALVAFSTSREYLPSVLPYTFSNGSWVTSHDWQMPSELSPCAAQCLTNLLGMTKRGVVVSVYTCPQTYNPTGSTGLDLQNYELGKRGKYHA
jgi:hypothetical protein